MDVRSAKPRVAIESLNLKHCRSRACAYFRRKKALPPADERQRKFLFYLRLVTGELADPPADEVTVMFVGCVKPVKMMV